MKNKQIITFIIIIISITSIKCDKISNEASFLSIENFSFSNNDKNETQPYSENFESIYITDTWITMNGVFLGAFEIPSEIPILNEGTHTFRMSPGIKENGISGSRMIYPFYKHCEFSENIFLNESINTNPVTDYKDNVNFKLLTEGKFEFGNMLQKTENSDTIPFTQNLEVFQGEKSCAICIDNDNPSLEVLTIEGISFDNYPEYIFMEMNFKSSIPIKIGLIKNEELQNKAEHMEIYPSENWKKIYLNLSQLIIPHISNSTFQVYFESEISENEVGGCIYLDNIKFVY